MGDSIFSNMMVLGAAWQNGLVPLSHEAILGAIELNGAAVERNKQAFDLGRWAVLNPEDAAKIGGDVVQMPKPLEDRIAFRAAHLVAYQGKRLAKRYRKLVDSVEDVALKEAVAIGYHKLLAYKDEYEVARLHLDTEAKAREMFEGDLKLSYHLAPPMLPGKDAAGRPRKRQFGAWMGRGFRVLARLRRLRGTPLDVFGYTAERKMERGLIRQYEADMAEVLTNVAPETSDIAVEIASLPRQIRGYGPVKEAHVEAANRRREELLAAFRAGGSPMATAAE
jgi:indolepyruvate ferredoxin oxidoreductase